MEVLLVLIGLMLLTVFVVAIVGTLTATAMVLAYRRRVTA